MNPENDVCHTPPHFECSPCDYIEFIEEINKALEQDALDPFADHDPIMHYAKAFEKGCNWVMHPSLSSPPIVGLKTSMTIATWQSPTFQPLFPNSNVKGG
jgi:hypothetical protein